MRREKTMKICANFFVAPGTSLKENAGSDRSWVWQCVDFSEEKSEVSTLAIRFANSESEQLARPLVCVPLALMWAMVYTCFTVHCVPFSDAQKFKEQFENAMECNKTAVSAESAAATDAGNPEITAATNAVQ